MINDHRVSRLLMRRPQERIKEYQRLVSRQLNRSKAPSGRELALKSIQTNLHASVAAKRISNARDAALKELSGRKEEQQGLGAEKSKISSAFSKLFCLSGSDIDK